MSIYKIIYIVLTINVNVYKMSKIVFPTVLVNMDINLIL